MSRPSVSIDSLFILARHHIRLLTPPTSPDASTLCNAVVHLETFLLNLRRADPPSPPLLWIDDVFAALHDALPYLPRNHDHNHHHHHHPAPPPRHISHHPPLHLPALLRSVRNLLLPPPPPSPVHAPLLKAAALVNEWIVAVEASGPRPAPSDDADDESRVSLSDALPPLPHQYTVCRDALYLQARDALLEATADAQRPANPATSAVALLGPRGVGKTMLARELVHDHDLTHFFSDGVTWIQLGPDINDEELADQIINCVETIIADDFRSKVRYSSLHHLVSLSSRVLKCVNTLVVVDDVSGPHAQRAFDLVISALGNSCVALYTAPLDDDEPIGETLILKNVACYARLHVPPLGAHSHEAHNIFKTWLRVTDPDADGEAGTKKRLDQRDTIVSACHGLPLPLAMTAGFLSRFSDTWQTLAETLDDSSCGEETIVRIMNLLLKKGGPKFEAQLRAIACLPQGVWVSLSALADLWGMDYRAIKISARRLGRLAFGEYRLGDSSDDSRVRFHFQIMRYCRDITSNADMMVANRKLLGNVSRRKGANGKPRLKSDYFPWWGACMSDKYICRRLHWHMARAGSMTKLNDLICDFQWVCQRLLRDGLIGIGIEFKLAMAAEERDGKPAEATGIQHMLTAIQGASKLQKFEALEMSALPTFLIATLADHESSSTACKDFLNSIYEKARRPWLRPIRSMEPSLISSRDEDTVTTEQDSYESDAFMQQMNCLAASSSGKVVCGDKVGSINVYNPATLKIIASWPCSEVGGHPQSRGVGAIATFGNDLIISGHFNGRLFLRCIRTGRTEALQTSGNSLDKITCIAASEHHDGVVAVGSHTGQLFVLKNVHGFNCSPKRIDLEGHCDIVTSLLVFPDGRRIASSSHDGFAAIWVIRSSGHERISLNGHKREIGHKENYITTFATIAGGKRLLSACRGGVVNAWNTETGDCLWAKRYGFEFSRTLSLQSYGIELFRSAMSDNGKPKKLLSIGNPYMISRGPGPEDLLILAAGGGRDILATITTDQPISTWLELWHPPTQRIFVAVSYIDGQLGSYELVTSLK